MKPQPFLMILLLMVFSVPAGHAADCAAFVRDFKENKIISSKAYQFESDQLYLPAAYCPFSPLNMVTDQKERAEFYLTEQCRETGYKVIKTTMMCAQNPKQAKVRSSCDVGGRILSPCLKPALTQALVKTAVAS